MLNFMKRGMLLDSKSKNLNYEIITNLLKEIINDKSNYINKKNNLKKLNYKNSWNDINQSLKKIINEN